MVFSKVYQELKLSFEEAAAITAEAGLDGIDCPLRPAGEILPERAKDELPQYIEVLRRQNLQLPLLTTAITGVASPHAETILRLARKLGVQFYRVGFANRDPAVGSSKQVAAMKAQLKDLAALNKQIGICGLVQNHSSSGNTEYLGGNLAELIQVVEGFAADQIGVAFDIAHALVMHGENWRGYFEQLKPHFKIAYVKDVKRQGGWVPFGEGDIARTGYFQELKALGYRAPISLHIEYDWSDKGQNKTRAALVKALKASSGKLRQWLAA